MRCLMLTVGLCLLTGMNVTLGFQGGYGAVYNKVGFHDRGGYFDAGFEAVVNQYGGNLIVTSTDVSIPSSGGFGLFFSRTHNSNYAYDAELGQPIAHHDSPLGLGWIATSASSIPIRKQAESTFGSMAAAHASCSTPTTTSTPRSP